MPSRFLVTRWWLRAFGPSDSLSLRKLRAFLELLSIHMKVRVCAELGQIAGGLLLPVSVEVRAAVLGVTGTLHKPEVRS